MRTLSFELRPSSVGHFGLALSLRQDVESLGNQLGIGVDFYADQESPYDLSETVQTAVYRVAHAALTNIVHHAEANHISVVMRKRGQRLHVLVEDDGSGFDPDTVLQGPVEARFGLLAMEERLRSVDGDLGVESAMGEGTTIYIDVPLRGSGSESGE